ncbi:MAG TPA: rhodanese-like domain-containing protein [Longimicrobiales bacterium]|nr:rhodanese-like domain-containing protein [Longimicrobiales bacterium]
MGLISRLLSRILPTPPRIEPGEDVVFLDVRTAPEFAAGHAAGAVHVPMGQVQRRLDELQPHKDRRILVYCLSGHRAGAATRALRERGFAKAENAGSLGALKRAGVQVER